MITGLRIHDEGRVQVADAPSDFSTREFLREILPSLRPGSVANDWELKDGSGGRVLSLDLTLEENEVRSHDELYLVPTAGANGLVRTICSECGSQNLSGAKFCSSCGHALAGKPAPGPLPRIAVAADKDRDEDLAFEVTSPDGKLQHCEAPGDTLTETFVRDLVDAFGLPRNDARGRTIEYRLLREASGEALHEKKTLVDNGVERGGRYVMERKRSLFGNGPTAVALMPPVRPTGDLWLHVLMPDGSSQRCEAAADTSTAEFTNDVVEQFKLPKVGPNGRNIAYVLVDQQTQVPLDPKKALADNGVADGHRLLIRAEARVVVEVEGWFQRHWKIVALVGVGLLVLVALVWAIVRPKPRSSIDATGTGVRPTSQPPRVAITPGRYELSAGGIVQFAARVTGTASQTVQWTIHPAVGTISPDGLYTAPAAVDAARDVHVEATSDGSPSATGRATLTLLPPTEALPPATTGTDAGSGTATLEGNATAALRISPRAVSLNGGDTARFVATGGAVQWSVSPAIGKISQNGVYTAPEVVTQPQRVKVLATGDTQAIATVNLQPVAVNRVTSSGDANGPMTFSASVAHTRNTGVSWSIRPQSGSISPSGVYTRDPKLKEATDLTVTATSVADPSKSASTIVHLVPTAIPKSNVSISINPFERVVLANQSVVFSATVTGSADRTVTWTSVGLGTIYGNGLFVAPKNAPAGDHVIHINATSHADPSKRAEGEFVLRVPAPFAGAKQGSLVWTGDLDRDAVLTIVGTRASTGVVTGELPGVAVAIRIETPRCTLVASPGPQNGWRSLAIRTGARLHSVTISWSVVP